MKKEFVPASDVHVLLVRRRKRGGSDGICAKTIKNVGFKWYLCIQLKLFLLYKNASVC